MRERYQNGSIKQRCGKWVGQWWEAGHRRNQVLGPSSMTKAKAGQELAKRLEALKATHGDISKDAVLADFVTEVYFPFYERKWKASTTACNVNRVDKHIVSEYGQRKLVSFRRDEVQSFLDRKTASDLSFSVVDHLPWGLRQIFGMSVDEGVITKKPASVLYTPEE